MAKDFGQVTKEEMMNRKFTFWYYTVSHQQALLRSIGKDGDDNIDLYFPAVSYIDIPVDIDGLEIVEPTDEDRQMIIDKLGTSLSSYDMITVLLHEDKRYYILSAQIKIIRNKMEWLELPFDLPCDMSGVFYRPQE